MLDDIAGLVLVQVVSNFGASGGTIEAKTALRPFLVSIAFVVAVLLGCRYIVAPLTRQLNSRNSPAPFFANAIQKLPFDGIIFIIHTSILFAIVAGATYAGTSPLFAAYVAGASINWWDEKFDSDLRDDYVESDVRRKHLEEERNVRDASTSGSGTDAISDHSNIETQRHDNSDEVSAFSKHKSHPSGAEIYAKYYSVLVERTLKPLFFVSNSSAFFLLVLGDPSLTNV
ncbi:MAG: hypothetical protein Q9160_005772 [Pyrenula sp. 1 TL-2023]